MGYHYNFKKKKFDKLGMLSIKAKQDNLTIYLNGTVYNGSQKNLFIPKAIWNSFEHTTELSISLLPDDYNLKVAKEGYWPWEKVFTVNPNQTTFTSNIFLFKNYPPVKLADGVFNNLIIDSKSKNHALYMIDNTLATSTILSYSDNNFHNLFKKEHVANFITSLSKERLLVNTGKDFLALDPISPDNIVSLNTLIKTNIVSAKWDDKNEYIVYALGKDNNLYKIDMIGGKSNKLSRLDNISDFTIHYGVIYQLEKSQNKSLLKVLGKEKYLIALPFTSDLKFIENNSRYLFIKSESSHILYIIDPSNGLFPPKIKATLADVDRFNWNGSNDKLLYSNGYEVWVYDFTNDRNYIITRVSEGIRHVLWIAQENYILFNTSTKINVIEASDIGNKNFINLWSAPDIEEISLDSSEKSDKLFFTGQGGLYSLALY